MRDTAHVASTGVVAVWKRSAFGGSMRHVELVDFHRKGIAMTKQSGDPSQEKSGGWEEYPVKRGIDGYSAYLQERVVSRFKRCSLVARKISLSLFLSGLLRVFDHDSGDSHGILTFDRLCTLF